MRSQIWIRLGLTITSLLLAGCEVDWAPMRDWVASPPILRSPQPKGGSGPTAQSSDTGAMEGQVYERINAIRQQEGLAALKPNETLAEVARSYSRRMAEEDFFSHTDPDGKSVAQRVQEAGLHYWVIGENLFYCTNAPDPASLAVQGWMDSPGHRENILRSNYSETGIGVWQDGNTYYFTQLFMRPMW